MQSNASTQSLSDAYVEIGLGSKPNSFPPLLVRQSLEGESGRKNFLTTLCLRAPQDEGGYPCSWRQDPDAHVDHFGFDGRAEV